MRLRPTTSILRSNSSAITRSTSTSVVIKRAYSTIRRVEDIPVPATLPETREFLAFEREFFDLKDNSIDAIRVRTETIPGPESKALLEDMNTMQEMSSVLLPANYEQSCGNYLTDADNNVFMDLYSQISSIPAGYNEPELWDAIKDKKVAALFANRPATGVHPTHRYADILRSGIMRLAPPGLDYVVTAATGAEAVENAYKLAFIHYMSTVRGTDVPTAEDMTSCMDNQAPGTPQLSILSFRHAFHGRTLGALSTTRSKPIHKVHFPAFPWPQASFPMLKYPLQEHEAENRKEEDRCLAEVRDILKRQKQQLGSPVAGVMVEPIQAEGGDNHASPYFFQQLQKICGEHDALFIVDEVQTGGGPTGKLWAHEHWNLSSPPDMVTFSKKLQAAGVYYKKELRPPQPFRIFSTWLGDPLRAAQVCVFANQLQRGKLIENTAITGKYLQDGLVALSSEFPDLVQNVRGQGTFCAVTLPSVEVRTDLIARMLHKGFIMGACGDRSVRFRPMLIFTPEHCRLFFEQFRQVLLDIKGKRA